MEFSTPSWIRFSRWLHTVSDGDSLLHAVVGRQEEGGWFANREQRSHVQAQIAQAMRDSIDTEVASREPAVMTAYVDFLRLLIAATCKVQVFDADGFARIKELARGTEVQGALKAWSDLHPHGRDGTPKWITSGTITAGDCINWITRLAGDQERVLCEAFASYLGEGRALWPSCVALLARVHSRAISLSIGGDKWIHFNALGVQCDRASVSSVAIAWTNGVFRRTTVPAERGYAYEQVPRQGVAMIENVGENGRTTA